MNGQTVPEQHLMLDGWRREIGTVNAPNGAPCEKCGKPSVWIFKRRTPSELMGIHGRSSPCPEAQEHPRCKDHMWPGDAGKMDAE